MSVGKFAVRLIKNTAIGGAAGYASGKFTSDQLGREAASSAGAKAGAVVGALSALPGAKMAQGLYNSSKIYSRGLAATPGSKVGSVIRKVGPGLAKAEGGVKKAVVGGKVMFRRIRGRIIAIRSK